MTKHTPGPWSVPHFASNSCSCNCGYIFSDAQYGMGAICNVYHNIKDDENEPIEVAIANARLIAAAPKLLEALIAAVDCGMVPISSAKEGGAVTHSIQVRVADQIRDAIAKATGETE